MRHYRSLTLAAAMAAGLFSGSILVPAVQGLTLVPAAFAQDGDTAAAQARVDSAKAALETQMGVSIATATPAQLAQAVADLAGSIDLEATMVALTEAGVDMTAFIGALARTNVSNTFLNNAIAYAVGMGADQTALVRTAVAARPGFTYLFVTTGGLTSSLAATLGVGSVSNAGGGSEGNIDCQRASDTDPLPDGCP